MAAPHLGEQDARMGFSYSDVLADCDAWLLAQSMQSDSSKGLCPPLCGHVSRKARRIELNGSISPVQGSADNLVIAFRKLVDGIDLGIFDNVSGSKKHCSLRHMQTDSRVKRRLVYWHYPMLNLLKIEPLINHDCDHCVGNDSAIPRNAPLIKRHRVIRAESNVITRTGKTITSTRNDMIPTRTCEAEEE